LNFTPGRDLAAVVEQHPQARRVQLLGQPRGDLEDLVVLAGGHQVHVGRGDLARPDQAALVVLLLGDGGDRAGDADAVGAHGDPHRLAVRAQHVEPEGVGVLAAELEDVADLDAPVDGQRATAARAGVPGAHLGGADGALRGEVAARGDVRGVPARLVGAGDPGRARHDQRVHLVGVSGLGEPLRADVAAHQRRVLGEVLGLEHLDLGRGDGRLEPLEVHLAVAGHADDQDLGSFFPGYRSLTTTFLSVSPR
jgi:hypothetical protein